MIKKNKVIILIVLAILLTASISVFITLKLTYVDSDFTKKEYDEYLDYKGLDAMGMVLNIEQRAYLQELSDIYGKAFNLQKMIEQFFYKDTVDIDFSLNAAKGLVAQLNDPYSYYLDEEEFLKLQETMNSEYVGIGVVVSPTEDGYITVVSPFKDSPAEHAGIRPLDKVVAVNGEYLTGEQLNRAIELIRGEAGTEVSVTFVRDNTEFTIVLERAVIKVETIYSEVMEDDIGYIGISQFGTKTGEEFEEHLNNLIESNVKGLIIDLRYNPGGELGALVKVADLLLDKQTIITLKNRQNEINKYTSDEEHRYDDPIIVLVNEGSASASEALTGALKDTGRGVIVGIKTFGKGVAQSLIPIEDGTALNITTAEYFTPNGTNVNDNGIEPDIIISDDIETEEDEQLEKAIEKLKELIE